MTAENPGRSKLAEFVSDQVLSHEHRDPSLAIVDGDRESDHFRDDRRTAGIRLDHLLLSSLIRLLNPFIQFLFDKRTFLD